MEGEARVRSDEGARKERGEIRGDGERYRIEIIPTFMVLFLYVPCSMWDVKYAGDCLPGNLHFA